MICRIIISLYFLLVPFSVNATDISIFAVNFSKETLSDVVLEELEKQLNREDSVVGIIDASDLKVVGYFNPKHPVYGSKETLRGILGEIDGRFSNAPSQVNLPLVILEVSEFVRGHYTAESAVDIFLVDVLKHQGRNFDFTRGYPNDGFLQLDDSDFSLIDGLSPDFESKVRALQIADDGFREQYLRFAFHLSERVLGGELVSFAYAASSPPISFDEPLSTPVTDLVVPISASRVVNAEERPVCEVEDVVEVVRKIGGLEVSVQNISRSNSVGNYLLETDGSKIEDQFSFDGDGRGIFSVKAIPGNGVLSVSDCSGDFVEQFKYDIGQLADVISVLAVSKDIARISGRNVQRADGSDVVIFDEKTGRRWVTQVADGRYSIDVPVAPGRHRFYVERPFSGEKQHFDVLLQEKCEINSSIAYEGALGKLVIQSTCSAQSKLLATYDNQSLTANFNAENKASIDFALTCGTSVGSWRIDGASENEFTTQYVIDQDRVSASEGALTVDLEIKNPSRANGKSKYTAIQGGKTLDGVLSFNADGIGVLTLPRSIAGRGVLNLVNCDGDLTQAGTYNVSAIDDEIEVSVLSDNSARITGENIQRPDGSQVTVRNKDSGERWTARVRNGKYSLDVQVPPGLQNFLASKPRNDGDYPFTVKTRDACRHTHNIDYDGGVALLSVNTDCIKDEPVEIEYNGNKYSKKMNSSGGVNFRLPMDCGEAQGKWKYLDSTDQFLTSYDCRGKLRVILRWNDPIDLDLHIQETANATFANQNWASFKNCLGPNNSECKAIGFINKDCKSSDCGTLKEEYYEADLARVMNISPSITVMVSNYTRDNDGKPKQPHCGSGEYAEVSYRLIAYIENERYVRRGTTEHNKRFSRVACDVPRSPLSFVEENVLTVPLR